MDSNNLLYDLFQAYYDARKNKRSTMNALAFEIDYESKLFELYKEIKSRKYEISRSICFISFEPVQREVFAADFRDRIVHHLIFNYINPIFERSFINDSYSCRVGKGTSYGIKRMDYFIRSCSKNYKKDCWILKMDIKGYFMSMDRNILYQKIKKTINEANHLEAKANLNIDLILFLIRKVVFHDPTKNCVTRGTKDDWVGLPKSKSLFFAGKDKGFPIGNLTSQLFGNIYLNDLDCFVKYKLGFKYYGRYVDDFFIIHSDKEYLKTSISVLREYLKMRLFLELHPNKIYFQHFSKGVKFLGAVIKPHRIYIQNRIKGNFYKKIRDWNAVFEEKKYNLTKNDTEKFLASINSYLGLMKHYKTYKLRKKMLTENLSPHFWNYFSVSENYGKITTISQKL